MSSFVGYLRRPFDDLLALLAPTGCAACDIRLATDQRVFCEAHQLLVEWLPAAQTSVVRAGCVYAGPVAEAIQRMKYAGRPDLARPLSRLVHHVLAHVACIDCVVPIPLHRRRLRARGYNQAALIGGVIATRLGVPLRTGLLRRLRHAPPQAALGLAERTENLREAFRASVGAADRRVLLVDDVCTTGSTLQAAAEALRQAGAARVSAVVLARAERGL